MSRTPHILLATVSMLAASISMATAAAADNIKQAAEQAAAGRYIIKYKAAVNTTGLRTENKAGKNAALQQLQASSALLQQKGARIHHILAARNAIAAQLDAKTLQQVKADPAVEYVEADLPRYPMMQQQPSLLGTRRST